MGQAQSTTEQQTQTRLRDLEKARLRKKESQRAWWQAFSDRAEAWKTGDPDIMDVGEAVSEAAVAEREEATRVYKALKAENERAVVLERAQQAGAEWAGRKRRKEEEGDGVSGGDGGDGDGDRNDGRGDEGHGWKEGAVEGNADSVEGGGKARS